MSKVVLVLFAASLALGATTLHLARELRTERASVKSLATRVAQLERTQRSAPALGVAATTRAPPAATTPAANSVAPTQSANATLTAPLVADPRAAHLRMMRESVARQRVLLRDPEYREAVRAQRKAMVPDMYPDLAQEVQLTPEEVEQLMSLLADQQIRAMETREHPYFVGSPDAATIEQLSRQAEEQRQVDDAEIRTLLGEQKWQAWQEYRASMGVRHELAQLRTTFASSGAPLEETQVKPLQSALLEVQQRQAAEWRQHVAGSRAAMNGDMLSAAAQLELQETALERQREHQEVLRESLRSILRSEQLRLLEEQHEAQLEVQQAHVRMMRARLAAEARGEVSATPDEAMGEAMMVTNGAFAIQVTP